MQQGGYEAYLGSYAPAVEDALREVQAGEVISRIWAKDHTVWSPDPTEITDRLDWLHAPEGMRRRLADLERLSGEIRGEGYLHIVLAGMGGSSVGSEVLRRLLGSGEEYPQLLVLDSTFPEWIDGLVQEIDPSKTLFVISSKSGSTLETACFYKFFRKLVEDKTDAPTQNSFVAITSPGTPLDRLAQDDGFREIIYNPEDVGSRYSGLSPLGLAPAVLAGMDVAQIIGWAESMADMCKPGTCTSENPGAWLGVVMAVMVMQGRDKLTLVTSPALESFGLWVEQMLAESTGKEGKAIVSVRGESPLSPEQYGPDRFFVFMQSADDKDSALHETMRAVKESGHPWVSIAVDSLYQVGAEFFRWQFATAVAGAVMGVHPFDQPNVQLAKDMTNSVLSEYRKSGSLPERQASGSVPELLADACPGSYAAVMVYARQTPEMDEALATLRRRVTDRYGVPVTLGYGPRILHSTGQMHKGGPDEGLFIQITCDSQIDLEIPGEDYSFGTLVEAQARADIRALRAIDRRVAHMHLGEVGPESLKRLAYMAI